MTELFNCMQITRTVDVFFSICFQGKLGVDGQPGKEGKLVSTGAQSVFLQRGVPNLVLLSRLTIERRRHSLQGAGGMLPRIFLIIMLGPQKWRFLDPEHKFLIITCIYNRGLQISLPEEMVTELKWISSALLIHMHTLLSTVVSLSTLYSDRI